MRVFKFSCFIIVLLSSKSLLAEDYFNPQFLGDDVASLKDLEYLTTGSVVTPGEYYLYVYSGEDFIKNFKIKFVSEDGVVKPCFTSDVVKRLPLKKELKEKISSSHKEEECIDLEKYIKGFDYETDITKLILRLSIPNVYLDATLSTMADESDWDNGITGYLMNYNFNGSYSKNKESSDFSSNYLSLNNKVNYGAWRFNANVYMSESKSGSNRQNNFDSNSIYLSRKINSLKSDLTLGQNSLGSSLFDASNYIGMTMSTSVEMLPESERGYSPAIRGIAESRSRLTIRQNNSIIYQTYVSPGPYSIDNLNPVGSSGDYEVELTAADGSVQKYIVPYSSLPNLLRPGNYNYSATIGKLDATEVNDVKFFQSTVSVGLPFASTLRVGAQLSDNYTSGGIGLGKDLGYFGALSVDALQANAKIKERKLSGQSYRILYSKSFNETGTNLQLTGYRYSSPDYYSLTEASRKNGEWRDSINQYYYGRKKDSFQINVTQSLRDYGQIYAWGNIDSYQGNNDSKTKNIQVGWSKNLVQFNNLMVSASYNKRNMGAYNDTVYYLSFSMPLTMGSSSNSAYLSNSTSYSKKDHSNSTSLYGNAMDSKLNYSISQDMNRDASSNTTNMYATYKTGASTLNAGTSYSSQTKQFDYGATGGVLFHSGGVVLSQEISDTSILVEAPGAEGTRVVEAGENIRINKSGYALVPYATAYHYNNIELDPSTFSNDFDIENKIAKVAPTSGAISKVKFNVKKGYTFLVAVKYRGKYIKFGTLVKNDAHGNMSIADDDGSVYLSGVENGSSFSVQLDNDKTCRFSINYPDASKLKTVNKREAECL